jgi:cytochrome c
MRTWSIALVIVLVAANASWLGAAQKPSRSVWEGVYTDAQAARGQKVYEKSCGGCHRDDLSGGDDSEPPLRGDHFSVKWEDSTLAGLFDFVATNMPKSNPGSLSLEACVDILAFMLKMNEMPAGQTELTKDIEALDQIRFTATRPPAR